MDEATKILRAASLSVADKSELYDLYREDLEEYSESTALDKLQSAMKEVADVDG